MKRAIAIVLAFAPAALAEESPKHLQDVPLQVERRTMERRDERDGRFEIRIEALVPTGSETTAKVRVKNLAEFVLEEMELTCTAFDERSAELASQAWRLKESGSSEMQPGESIAVTLRFGVPATKVRSATCNARGW